MSEPKKEITWISANDWIEMQTLAVIQNFGRSRPTPRAKRMGLKEEAKKKPIGYEKLSLNTLS